MLRVTTADGRTREYPIDLPSLVVGRADGNSIVIDDLSVSRRHARLVIDSGRLLIEDLGSATGTFVGGQRIPVNTPSLADNGQELRFGDVVATYQAPASSQSDQGADDAAAAPLVELPATIRTTLSVPPQPVETGSAPAVALLTIQNRGRIVDELSIRVLDLPAEWVRISKPKVVLVPGDQSEVTIVIQPPRRFDSHAQEYDFSVVVTSRETEREVLAHGKMTVLPFDATVLSMHPVRSKKLFTLTAENQGNAATMYALSGLDDEEAFVYEFETPTIELQPGQQRVTAVRISPKKRKLLGRATAVPFSLIATPTNAGAATKASVVGQLAIKPPLQPFVKPAMFTLMAAVIAVAALIYFFWPSSNRVQSANAEAAYAGVHMCDKAKEDRPPEPTGNSAAPLFAQNDPAWADIEYAKAQDPEFGPDWCGTTIEQCGCAMTSVATVMALFQDLTMPDGSDLTPQTVNAWFNENARKTSKGWVSQGYVYGDVVWTAANQLSGEIAAAHPGAHTIRFSRMGTGSDEEIRSELRAGRPIILAVPGHYIAAVGLDGDKILINDPYYRDRKTLDVYAGKVLSSVLFEPSDDLSGVVVTVPSNVRVRVTDKEGRIVGTLNTGTPAEAQKAAQQGVPGSSYSLQAAWRDPSCVESPPPPGAGTNQIILPGTKDDYKIEVLDSGGGPTSVAIHSYDKHGVVSVETQDNPGPAVLTVDYDPNKAQTKVNVVPGATVSPEPQQPSPPPGGLNGAGTPAKPGGSATASGTAGGSATAGGTPTSQATSTPTATPTIAPPNNVAVACTPTYNQTETTKTAEVKCTATIDGTFTNTTWTLNGVTLPSASGKATASTTFDSDTTAVISIRACNVTACRTGSSTVGVQFPSLPAAPTPTATPTSNATPTATPAVAPSNAAVSCSDNGAGVTCSVSFVGDYSSVEWMAPGAPDAGAQSGSKSFTLPFSVTDTGNGFTVTLGTRTTAILSYGANASQIQSALGEGVTVSGTGPFTLSIPVWARVWNGSEYQDSSTVTVSMPIVVPPFTIACDNEDYYGVFCHPTAEGGYSLTWHAPGGENGVANTQPSLQLWAGTQSGGDSAYGIYIVEQFTEPSIPYDSTASEIQPYLDATFGVGAVTISGNGPPAFTLTMPVWATVCYNGTCRDSNHVSVQLTIDLYSGPG